MSATEPSRSLTELASSVQDARTRAMQLLAAHGERMARMEATLSGEVQRINDELSHDRECVAAEHEDLEQKANDLARQKDDFAAQQLAWEQAEQEARDQQHELAAYLDGEQVKHELRRKELEKQEKELQQLERTLDSSRQELAEESSDLARVKQRWEEKSTALDEELLHASEERARTKNQRQRIARSFQERRSEFQEDCQRKRAELEDLSLRSALSVEEKDRRIEELSGELRSVRAEMDRLQAAVDEERAGRTSVESMLDEVRRQREELENQLGETQQALATAEKTESVPCALDEIEQQLSAERTAREQIELQLRAAGEATESLRTERDQLAAALAEAESQLIQHGGGEGEQHKLEELERKFALAVEDLRTQKRRNSELEEELSERPTVEGVDQRTFESLRAERDALVDRLADLQLRCEEPANDEHRQKMDDLQRRFEMAVDDVRSLRAENAELQEQLKSARSNSAKPVETSGVTLDWEAQKRKILASLESDFDEDEEGDRDQKLSIEGAIHITDEVVAEKDREISELKRLLDDQSHSIGDMAIGAAAIADVLDRDELIREERRRLTSLQAEWQEKMRQSEIEISVDRAKIARRRAELEEKSQALEQQLARQQAETQPPGDQNQPKSGHGRWWARLGLRDSEDDA